MTTADISMNIPADLEIEFCDESSIRFVAYTDGKAALEAVAEYAPGATLDYDGPCPTVRI